MINGVEYGFEDIKIGMLGRSLVGFSAIEYGATKEHSNVHGRGNEPVAMARGKKDAEPCKLTIHQSEFEAMQKIAPVGSDPTDWAPFDIAVCYQMDSGDLVTDVVPFCRINRWKKGMSNADQSMSIDLEMTTGIPQLNV
jgi:hypothetical protein